MGLLFIYDLCFEDLAALAAALLAAAAREPGAWASAIGLADSQPARATWLAVSF